METTPEPAPGVQEALDEKDQLEEEVRKLKKNIRKVNIDFLVEVYLLDLIDVVGSPGIVVEVTYSRLGCRVRCPGFNGVSWLTYRPGVQWGFCSVSLS